MNIQDLENKLVAVLGFGQEGQAVSKYLLKHGIKPVLFDQKPWGEWPKEKQNEIKKLEVNFTFGPEAFKKLAGFEVAFRSPGIPISKIQMPKSKCQITSQTKFFFNNCPAKLIGVTGTKGKGTTATLISEILKSQRQMSNVKCQTYLTGNIGKEQPLNILDDLKKDDWVVYELSSFQLQDLKQSPHIGVVLMITQEHLDYHKNTEEYREAKESIVKFQTKGDFAVINADFPESMAIGRLGESAKLYFSRQQKVMPGCFVANDKILYIGPDGKTQDIVKINELLLKGSHNLENACAAVIAAHCAGCSDNTIMQILRNFKGLEHRLELVAEKNGIKFYNDSFSTTPETAIAAIRSFNEPLIVILGGSSKHSDFTELGKTIKDSKNIKALILVGLEAVRIKSAINKPEIAILEGAKNMPEIFEQIKSTAKKGDVILLSPACASFDMFKNYQDRGEQYKNCVNNF